MVYYYFSRTFRFVFPHVKMKIIITYTNRREYQWQYSSGRPAHRRCIGVLAVVRCRWVAQRWCRRRRRRKCDSAEGAVSRAHSVPSPGLPGRRRRGRRSRSSVDRPVPIPSFMQTSYVREPVHVFTKKKFLKLNNLKFYYY